MVHDFSLICSATQPVLRKGGSSEKRGYDRRGEEGSRSLLYSYIIEVGYVKRGWGMKIRSIEMTQKVGDLLEL